MSPQGACCGNFAWKDARDAYFNALTSTTESQRKLWYAQTFRTLGHLIHHVQDAAVPSHTRNDNHLQPFEFTKLPDGDPFHHWADSAAGRDLIGVSQALRFDSSILNQGSPNSLAPVPVARIIDKTDGDIGILSPNVNIGLAEYSNANFISKGTGKLEASGYQYSNSTQLIIQNELGPNNLPRPYARFRPGFGEQDYRVGVSTRLSGFVNATIPPDKFPLLLDDKVHEDYGRKLFPRAIGYSAGLIDYFFRGGISAFAGDMGCYWPQVPPTQPSVEMVVSNEGPEGEETGAGQVEFIVHYEVGGVKNFFPLVSQSVFLERGQVTRFMFSTAPLNAVPTDAVNVFMIVVYRGPLGNEMDAVIGGTGFLFGLC